MIRLVLAWVLCVLLCSPVSAAPPPPAVQGYGISLTQDQIYSVNFTAQTATALGTLHSITSGKTLANCIGVTWEEGSAASYYLIDSAGIVWHGGFSSNLQYTVDSGLVSQGNLTVLGICELQGTYYALAYNPITQVSELFRFPSGFTSPAYFVTLLECLGNPNPAIISGAYSANAQDDYCTDGALGSASWFQLNPSSGDLGLEGVGQSPYYGITAASDGNIYGAVNVGASTYVSKVLGGGIPGLTKEFGFSFHVIAFKH